MFSQIVISRARHTQPLSHSYQMGKIRLTDAAKSTWSLALRYTLAQIARPSRERRRESANNPWAVEQRRSFSHHGKC